jgi:hypothetical protein
MSLSSVGIFLGTRITITEAMVSRKNTERTVADISETQGWRRERRRRRGTAGRENNDYGSNSILLGLSRSHLFSTQFPLSIK